LVTIDDKLPAKYGNLRKQSEEDKTISAFVSDYFYHYRFFLSLPFLFRLESQKILENDFQKSEIIIFVFFPTWYMACIQRTCHTQLLRVSAHDAGNVKDVTPNTPSVRLIMQLRETCRSNCVNFDQIYNKKY
jgi:hypothetical protein